LRVRLLEWLSARAYDPLTCRIARAGIYVNSACLIRSKPNVGLKMSDTDQVTFQRLLVRSNRRWLEILNQPKPPIDDEEVLAIWEELWSILAKYDTANLKAA